MTITTDEITITDEEKAGNEEREREREKPPDTGIPMARERVWSQTTTQDWNETG